MTGSARRSPEGPGTGGRTLLFRGEVESRTFRSDLEVEGLAVRFGTTVNHWSGVGRRDVDPTPPGPDRSLHRLFSRRLFHLIVC